MTGQFDIQCTEIRGIGHGLMPARIIVTDEATTGVAPFDDSRGRPSGPRVSSGARRNSMSSPAAEAGVAHSAHEAHSSDGFFTKYFWSTDHKVIGKQYLFTGMAMALLGGFTVYVFRMQLAFPGAHVPGWGRVNAGDYNALVTTHGSVMIFWVAMPVLIAALGNYLIPLMIGPRRHGVPAAEPALVSNLLAVCAGALRLLPRAGRLRRRLDVVPAALGKG